MTQCRRDRPPGLISSSTPELTRWSGTGTSRSLWEPWSRKTSQWTVLILFPVLMSAISGIFPSSTLSSVAISWSPAWRTWKGLRSKRDRGFRVNETWREAQTFCPIFCQCFPVSEERLRKSDYLVQWSEKSVRKWGWIFCFVFARQLKFELNCVLADDFLSQCT